MNTNKAHHIPITKFKTQVPSTGLVPLADVIMIIMCNNCIDTFSSII